jgi:chromate transporter
MAQSSKPEGERPREDKSAAGSEWDRRQGDKLREVALLFLRLGFTAFGGPAAHIAIMQDEVVRRRKWISLERFLDLLGAANLIPGPSSTELAIFLGYEQAGWAGLVLAGVCFILPAALMVAAIAWAYVRYHGLPPIEGALYGVKPVVIAVIVQALAMLGPKALKKSAVRPQGDRSATSLGHGTGRNEWSWWLGGVCSAACVASALGAPELAVLVGAGAVSLARGVVGAGKGRQGLLPSLLAPTALGKLGVAVPVSLGTLFLTFLKVGAVVFGSGYVLLAFLRADLVHRLGWLTEGQLVDAVAVGQVTPGPVFTTATFLGYVLAGGWGAVLATVGIFLPGFVLVAVTRPLLGRIRRSPLAGMFLDGVNAASLALMAVVAVELARASLVDVPAVLLALVAGGLLLGARVSSSWLVFGGALFGLARQYVLHER